MVYQRVWYIVANMNGKYLPREIMMHLGALSPRWWTCPARCLDPKPMLNKPTSGVLSRCICCQRYWGCGCCFGCCLCASVIIYVIIDIVDLVCFTGGYKGVHHRGNKHPSPQTTKTRIGWRTNRIKFTSASRCMQGFWTGSYFGKSHAFHEVHRSSLDEYLGKTVPSALVKIPFFSAGLNGIYYALL